MPSLYCLLIRQKSLLLNINDLLLRLFVLIQVFEKFNVSTWRFFLEFLKLPIKRSYCFTLKILNFWVWLKFFVSFFLASFLFNAFNLLFSLIFLIANKEIGDLIFFLKDNEVYFWNISLIIKYTFVGLKKFLLVHFFNLLLKNPKLAGLIGSGDLANILLFQFVESMCCLLNILFLASCLLSSENV